MILTALVFSVAGCAVFLAAHGTGALYLARSLQGIATGLATGPAGAALIELQPAGSQRAPLVTSAFSTLGLALGALITSALVQYAPAPTHLIWWALLSVFAAGIVAVLAMAEPGSRRPGVLASLRPRIAVPRQARATFAGAVPCFVATWALGGLYLSLGPSLAATATGSPNLLWGGLVIFLICGTGATAAFVLRGISSRAAMLAGCLFCSRAWRCVRRHRDDDGRRLPRRYRSSRRGLWSRLLRRLPDDPCPGHALAERGLVTAIFTVGYLAFSIPALIAGVATTKFGLHPTALVYTASLAALVAVAAGILLFGLRPAHTASPGLAYGHATRPMYLSTMPAGHEPTGRQPGNDR